MWPDFDSLYRELCPTLERLEDYRRELRAQGSRWGLLAGALCLLAGVLTACSVVEMWQLVMAIAAVVAIASWYFCVASRGGRLNAAYKEQVIGAMVSRLCEGAEYRPDEGISQRQFEDSGLFSTRPDRYRSEDRISGRIDRTDFVCSEIVAEERQVTVDSKGRRHEQWVDIFRGFFFIADFQKDFQGRTVVCRNSWFRWPSSRRVKLENPAFEKRFDTYSTDQVEARYLLTPGMMERLLALDDRFPGKITLSFVDSRIVVAIPDAKDHFETGIWRNQLDPGILSREYEVLTALLGIVNDLQLNCRIWTKQ